MSKTSRESHHQPSKHESKTRKPTGSRGGFGKTRKHPQAVRELSEQLYAHSSLTIKKIAEIANVPEMTMNNWFKGTELPIHRRNIQGTVPEDLIKAQSARIKELEEQNESYRERLIATQNDPLALESLIVQYKQTLATGAVNAEVGEAAAALRILMALRKEEEEREARQKPEDQNAKPQWFIDYMERERKSPTVRPPSTEFGQGIIPAPSAEDGDRGAFDESDDPKDLEHGKSVTTGLQSQLSEDGDDDEADDPDYADDDDDEL